MSGIEFRDLVIYGPLLIPTIVLLALSMSRLFTMYIVDRLINGYELAIVLVVVFTLVAVAFAAKGPAAVGPIILLTVVVGMIPLLPALAQRARGYHLMREDIARYMNSLKRQPDVPYPHLKLGQIYQQREDWDRAIEHYQAYLDVHARSPEARRELQRCLDRKRIRDMGLRRCPVCGEENPDRQVRCDKCDFYLKGATEIVVALLTPETMEYLQFLAVICAVGGLLGALLTDAVPLEASLAILSVSVVATVVFLYGRMIHEGG